MTELRKAAKRLGHLPAAQQILVAARANGPGNQGYDECSDPSRTWLTRIHTSDLQVTTTRESISSRRGTHPPRAAS